MPMAAALSFKFAATALFFSFSSSGVNPTKQIHFYKY
jgi:hypothetical protein